jgi:hypothetical protein
MGRSPQSCGCQYGRVQRLIVNGRHHTRGRRTGAFSGRSDLPSCQRLMTAVGRVSRVSPVQTAMHNCTRDEGRSFEAGQSGSGLKPLQAAVVKSDGGERCS